MLDKISKYTRMFMLCIYILYIHYIVFGTMLSWLYARESPVSVSVSVFLVVSRGRGRGIAMKLKLKRNALDQQLKNKQSIK